MQFDDHEIWGAPVQAPEPHEAAPVEVPAAAPSGRLYKSAGCEEPVDAIVALPGHQRRHTAAHPIEPTTRSSGPIAISSLIPRPAPIDDPAIAEVLASPAATPESPLHGFTAWFRQSGATPRESTPEDRTSLPTPSTSRMPRGLLAPSLSPLAFAALVLAVTVVVGAVNAHQSGTPGFVTGVVFAAACIIGAWRLDRSDRWAGWVLPSYLLIVAAILAGQFGAAAPGLSLPGQVMVVITTLITLAPWLALTTLANAALPLLRGRRT